MNILQRALHRPFFIRLFHWEYWSFNMVYAWIMPVWLWLALRARSFFFFSASNPSIEYGGFLMESKKKIYDILPAQYYPPTLYFSAGTTTEEIHCRITANGFAYPLVAKPDIGGRGRGVKKVYSSQELESYAAASTMDFLVQPFIDLPNEVGIFYYRYPGAATGKISGVVSKELLSVTGDGKASIHELLRSNKRAILQLPALTKLYGEALHQVLPAGVKQVLVPYGNHARGACFLDDTHRVDDQLEKTIDAICRQVEGFYFGRLDIRFGTWDALKNGQQLSIIELNGAGSEPTHMYDPRHSIFFAWKEIIRHWIILWRISRINHKNGIAYLTHQEGMKMMKDNSLFEQKLEKLYA